MKLLNSKGFGLISVLVVVVMLAVAGGAGAYVYHRNHTAKATNSSNRSAQTSSNSSTQGNASNNTTTSTDPYAGWKTYTDTTYHYSFKYPANGWEIDTSSSGQTTLLNSSRSIEVDYINPYTHDDAPTSFTAVSINDLADTSQELKVVGGLYNNVTPEYSVVDVSTLSTYPLAVGKSSQFPGAPRFTDKHASGSYSGAFQAKSIISGAQTDAWFSTADAKTSLLILESLTYQ